MSAIVLLSGGLDSAVSLGIADIAEDEVCAVTVDYGQRPAEILAAKTLADIYGCEHHILTVKGLCKDAALIAGPVPKELPEHGLSPAYFPGRNTVLIGLAFSVCEEKGFNRIYTGFTTTGLNNYPDTRPDYVKAWQQVINQASEGKIQLMSPLQTKAKHHVVKIGKALRVPFEHTVSCYAGAPACGECIACKSRLQAFDDVGSTDPIEYLSSAEKTI